MKRYIMIGAPVSTVRTPPLLETALLDAGVDANVSLRHVEAGALAEFMTEFRADTGTDGLLVTMPHKKTILAHMDVLSPAATLAGSVNTVKRLRSGGLAGAQFDGMALINALTGKNIPTKACRVLLAGLGGAGLAIAQAVATHGCKHLALAEIEPGLLKRALLEVGSMANFPVAAATSPEDFDLLINATPLGMCANDPSPFDARQVATASYIADIVADPPQTILSNLATAAGKTIITGRDMVTGQIEPIRDWLLEP